jgi:hypothetical protein
MENFWVVRLYEEYPTEPEHSALREFGVFGDIETAKKAVIEKIAEDADTITSIDLEFSSEEVKTYIINVDHDDNPPYFYVATATKKRTLGWA